MISIVNFNNIDNEQMLEVAKDLTQLLTVDNGDIETEFPDTFLKYSSSPEQVYENLITVRDRCEEGVRQQFISFLGKKAVGMSIIRITEDTPDIFNYNTPNVSGFVCNPYRNIGIGKLSMRAKFPYLTEQFGGEAWTRIKIVNFPSKKVTQSGGFTLVGSDAEGLLFYLDLKIAEV